MVESRILRKNIELRQSRGTSLIEIGAFHSDPKTAAAVANTIAQVFAAQPKPQNGPAEIRVIDLAQPALHAGRPNTALLVILATVLNTLFALFAGFFAANFFR